LKRIHAVSCVLALSLCAANLFGGCNLQAIPQTESTTEENKSVIVFSDSFKIPSPDHVNAYEYEQTEEAEKLVEHMEEYFGIEKLTPTENCNDTFFDARGADENGSEITFQQNTVSGAFIYSATFSIANNREFSKSNDASKLEKQKAKLTDKAEDIAEEFEDLTGELTLFRVTKETWSCTTNVTATYEFDEYSYDTYSFVFRQKDKTEFQVDDKTVCTEQYSGNDFYILLRPDGMVINMNCCLTKAPLKKVGEEKMFNVGQFLAYEQALYTDSLAGEGGPSIPNGEQKVFTDCRLVYTNNGVSSPKCDPGVVLSYYFSGSPSDIIEEYEPISFLRDGL